MMTVANAAKQLNVSKRFVYQLCAKGLLEHFKLGSSIRISDQAIEDYLDRQKKGLSQPETEKGTKRLSSLQFLRLRGG